MKTLQASPRASLLIESMRDIGYSLETALADVIDNSITAEATTVRMYSDTSSSEPTFAIIDDGCGMDQELLYRAMRLGSCSPLEKRSTLDLGRFGLGLKTASFSQCRCLTVVTRRSGKTSCARWDLDYVAKTDDWLVQIPPDPEKIRWIDKLGKQGTLILWERLDRLDVQKSGTDSGSYLVHQINEATLHLELVFHRYLTGEKGIKKIKLFINDHPLEAFDPFHSKHPATVAGPVENIRANGQVVVVQTFTLPHHNKVTAAEWEKYAGRGGYVKNQGFYVYRGKRLIIYGTWFGLARQMELTKLARVRIDMPNTLDADWKIDVKKASAHPPPQIRDRLRRMIDSMGATSRSVYEKKGKKLTSQNRLPVWLRLQKDGNICYALDPNHPVLKHFMSKLTAGMKTEFETIVEMVGASIPVDALFADMGGTPEHVSGNAMSSESLDYIFKTVVDDFRKGNLALNDIRDMLQLAEPFRSNWARTEALLKALAEKGE